MAYEYDRPSCGEHLHDETTANLITRAAAHNHSHHGGPESITPEIEAAISAGTTAA